MINCGCCQTHSELRVAATRLGELKFKLPPGTGTVPKNQPLPPNPRLTPTCLISREPVANTPLSFPDWRIPSPMGFYGTNTQRRSIP
jgi:hypothetical protein